MTYYPNSIMPQQCYYGGGYQQYPSPSYPLGYGGYYSNNYTMYNPYEMQKRQEEMQRKQQEYIKGQQDIMAMIYRASCMGREPDPTVISGIYGNNNQDPRLNGLSESEKQIYYNKVSFEQAINNSNVLTEQLCRSGNVQQPQQQYYSAVKPMEDMSLYEYFNGTQATEDLRKAEENAVRKQQSNLQSLYNKNTYNNFLSKFTVGGQQQKPNSNIDDMTISLPNKITEKDRADRRMAFLQAIGLKG